MSFILENLWHGADLAHMRRLLYITSPNETFTFEHESFCFQSLFDNSHFWFLFLILAEWGYYLVKGIEPNHYLWADSFTSAGAGMIESTLRVFTRSFEYRYYIWIHDNFSIAELPLYSFTTWIVAFFAIDFMYYWCHRMAHTSMILWSLHQIHHSTNYMNFTNSLRLSLIEHIFVAPVYYLPCALFLPPQVPLAHAYLNLVYQFWIHTELITSVGPFEWVFNTASHHRVHHGRNEYCIDKNFGGVLIIWDRLFGTFEWERKEEPVAYGLVTPLETFDQGYIQLFYIWEAIYVKPKSMIGWKNKVQAVFRNPGWTPQGQYPIPPIEKPLKRYVAPVPHWVDIYILLHLVFNVEVYMYIFELKSRINEGTLAFCGLYIVYSACCFGYLLDTRWFTRYLEIGRLLAIYLFSPLAPMLLMEAYLFKVLYHAIFLGSLFMWTCYSDKLLHLNTEF